MKNRLFISIIFCFCGFICFCETFGRDDPDTTNWDIAILDTARDVLYLSQIEKDVILEMNMVRTDPAKYAELYIKPMLKYYNGNLYQKPGEITIQTYEGKKSVEECIRVLSSMDSVSILMPELGLSYAAKDHTLDQGKGGKTGHNGSDGSTLRDRIQRYGEFSGHGYRSWGENISYGQSSSRDIVLQLLIDDGVSTRGHRNNIMNKNFTQVGVSFGIHSRFEKMCTIDYATGYISKE